MGAFVDLSLTSLKVAWALSFHLNLLALSTSVMGTKIELKFFTNLL